MTDDLIETVRAALAAAVNAHDPSNSAVELWARNVRHLNKQAPEWLAQLCDEVERLQSENERQRKMAHAVGYMDVVAERDKWRKIADALAMEASRGGHLSFGMILDAYDDAVKAEQT